METCAVETSCGLVTADERDEIRRLFQRKIALGELFQAISKMEPQVMDRLYEKVLLDLGETASKFHSWWDTKARQYKWKTIEGANWRIDFDTCEVFLVHP